MAYDISLSPSTVDGRLISALSRRLRRILTVEITSTVLHTLRSSRGNKHCFCAFTTLPPYADLRPYILLSIQSHIRTLRQTLDLDWSAIFLES